MHVTDPAHVRALWEMGFFGKGNLSRSEPTWTERERGGAEGATDRRREERRLFKLERARVEREGVERQRRVERGEVLADDGVTVATATIGEVVEGDGAVDEAAKRGDASTNGHIDDITKAPITTTTHHPPPLLTTNEKEEDLPLQPPTNQEHLQLTPSESLFLTYALGILLIHPPLAPPSPPISPLTTPTPYTPSTLLPLFITSLAPDDAFLLSYTTYHHFRSLGWVVRPATKFGADYLLYNRGPVFSHAEFAVVIIPAYTHRYWNTPGGRARRLVGEGEEMGWWGLHAVNRVQSAVKKTLVLAYVDVPSPIEVTGFWNGDGEAGRVDLGRLLRMYSVREVVVRRWLANRSRD